jgi:putative serine protease PepD
VSDRPETERPGARSAWAPPPPDQPWVSDDQAPGPAPWDRPAPEDRDLYADLSAPPGHPDQPPFDPFGPPPPVPVATAGDLATVGVRDRPARRRRAALLLTVGAVALVAGGTGGAAGAYLVARERGEVLTDPSVELPPAAPGSTARSADSTAGIVAAVAPSVVTLKVSGGGGQGTGSGFILDGNGYILTNNHVVAPASGTGTARVRVVFSNGRQADATVVGRDVSYDLAVVKADVGSRRALPLGDSDSVRVGDPVIAVGAPLGLQGTVTTGIISARNRPVAAGQAQETSFINALQTDAAINPGNSGGPLLDEQGRVIGVNAAIARIPGSGVIDSTGGNIGLGFAIPSKQARRTAQQLIRTGKAQHPVIGALLDDDGAETDGVRIATTGTGGRPALTPGGPAATAGIKPGDLILAVDGQPVNSLPELVVAIRSHEPGETIRLTVRSGGTQRTVPVRLAAADG